MTSKEYGLRLTYPFRRFSSINCPKLHTWKAHFRRIGIGVTIMSYSDGSVDLGVDREAHLRVLRETDAFKDNEEENAFIRECIDGNGGVYDRQQGKN